SSTITATDSGNTTTLGFATPTATVTLNFPALSAGTYTICTTNGNCAGSGNGVTTGGGTTGKIAKFTGSQAIADSSISESGSTITVTGTTNSTTAIQLGGADINTAGTLSNVAYLNQTQSFTGANTFSRNGTGTGDASLLVTGTPVNDATSSLIRIGSSIASGN